MISIKLTSVIVNDQVRALAFYTEMLGFVLKQDIPMGDARWLTVVSPADPDGVHLLLEPTGFEFRGQQTTGPGPATATLDDTCGNLIQLYQMNDV